MSTVANLIFLVLLIAVSIVVYVIVSNWFQKVADKMVEKLKQDDKSN